MDYKETMEEMESELVKNSWSLFSFADEMDDLIIRYLVTNPQLLEDDAHRFLLDYALTDLARLNLRRLEMEYTKENMETEKGYLVLFAQNAGESEKSENKLFAPIVDWLFELVCYYKAQLREE